MCERQKCTCGAGEATRGQPEVGDPAGCADSRSCYHHHVLAATQLHQPGHGGQAATGPGAGGQTGLDWDAAAGAGERAETRTEHR